MAYKILVVDDDRTIRSAIAEYLTGNGYEAITAEDAKAAVVLLKASRFEMVIMEVNLPRYPGGYSGQYLLNHLRYRYPQIRTIAITGNSSIETGLEVIRLGASYWMTKPFSLNALKNRISIIIGLGNIRRLTDRRNKRHVYPS